MSFKYNIVQDKENILSDCNSFSVEKLETVIEAKFPRKNLRINVVLVDNKFIQSLNNQFRKKDEPTDVLSFNISDELGEIYLSPSFIREHLTQGVSFEEELCRMLVHGTLHLLGFDHDNYFTKGILNKEPMFAIQEEILQDMSK